MNKQLYCRDCKWWCGPKISIGRKCMNTTRKTFNVGKRDTHLYKYPCTKACKTGFEPKEKSDDRTS